jgi:hypothetical protein
LPANALQHIFGSASSPHTPGSCLAAVVCRTWQSAAAGCKGIRLLYRAGPAYESFIAWLGHGSQQLEALILSGYSDTDNVLGALADAAEAAATSGEPLRLRTLRVLGCVELALAGRLIAALPFLHTLCNTVHPLGCHVLLDSVSAMA